MRVTRQYGFICVAIAGPLFHAGDGDYAKCQISRYVTRFHRIQYWVFRIRAAALLWGDIKSLEIVAKSQGQLLSTVSQEKY